MNEYFNAIFGNDDIKSVFSQCISQDRMSHAYMLSGPDGSGKKTFARTVACELALHTGADKTLVKKIADGFSPDIFWLPKEEKNTADELGKSIETEFSKRIGVDAVRDFVSSMYLTPNELDFKMYIFGRADALTPQAQNALLKVIEEPPSNVYIFLCCRSPEMILKTVRSRVINIQMETFSEERIKEYLDKSVKGQEILSDEERLSFALRMSGGAIGAVKRLSDSENEEYNAYLAAKQTLSSLSEKNRGVCYFDYLRIFAGYADSSDKLILLLKYLILIYGDILSIQSLEDAHAEVLEQLSAEKYASAFATDTVLSSLEVISEVRKNMDLNANLSCSAIYLAENLWRKT